MLYERWRQIARACPGEIALRDVASGGQWTFRQLADETDRTVEVGSPFAFPRGLSADFVRSVLFAWRNGQIVCPMESEPSPPAISPGLPPDTVHLKTTSATTGGPRLIAFNAAQLLADAENITTTMGLRPDWPNLGVISLAHSYGFSNLVLPLLLQGIPLILAGAPLPELLKRGAAAEREIALPAVPALWQLWHEAGAIPANVRLAISAGAPLPLALEQSVFASRGLKIHNFYGSSECGGIAFDASAGPRTEGDCVGAAMNQVRLAVADNGCLEVRSGAVGQTYWPQPAPYLGGGRFRTNDLAEICHGLVYLRGRAGDQINIAGRKVSPEWIEGALRLHPAVRECLVFGAPAADLQRSEIIVACVESRTPVTGESLKQFLLATLPAWQVPREWWLVESLAANDRGKRSRAEWRKRFLKLTEAGGGAR